MPSNGVGMNPTVLNNSTRRVALTSPSAYTTFFVESIRRPVLLVVFSSKTNCAKRSTRLSSASVARRFSGSMSLTGFPMRFLSPCAEAFRDAAITASVSLSRGMNFSAPTESPPCRAFHLAFRAAPVSDPPVMERSPHSLRRGETSANARPCALMGDGFTHALPPASERRLAR